MTALRIWHDALQTKRDQLLPLGFDARFIRKWLYHLCYCEAALAMHNISVAHPFTAPAVRPAMNSFCSRRNRHKTGATETSVPAMIIP